MASRRILKITCLIVLLVCLLLVSFRGFNLIVFTKYIQFSPGLTLDVSRLTAFTTTNKTGHQTDADANHISSALTGKPNENGYQSDRIIGPQIPTINGNVKKPDFELRSPPITGESSEIDHQTDLDIDQQKPVKTGTSNQNAQKTEIDIDNSKPLIPKQSKEIEHQTGLSLDKQESHIEQTPSTSGYKSKEDIKDKPSITENSSKKEFQFKMDIANHKIPMPEQSNTIVNQNDLTIDKEKLTIPEKSSETGYQKLEVINQQKPAINDVSSKIGTQTNINNGRSETGTRPVVKNSSAKGIDQKPALRAQPIVDTVKQVLPKKGKHKVIVWGQAIISMFLWRHILGGEVEKPNTISPNYGSVTHGNISFRLYNGVKPLPESVEATAEYMIVVLKESAMGRNWFQTNMENRFTHLKKLALVVLGSEQCHNVWLHKHMRHNGGQIDAMFLVYDTPEIDDKAFYQWPLGVSVHRGFPVVNISADTLNRKRKYLCNFMGSLSTSPTRLQLMSILKTSPMNKSIYTRVRHTWIGNEDKQSMQQYVDVLSDSDLTLCPVGHNTECFRMYEAMAFGSVPVVHNIMTKGHCGSSKVSNVYPLRLLKDFHAPMLYVKSWSELPKILEKEQNMTLEEKVKRRKEIVTWYRDFKLRIRDMFLTVIHQHFFSGHGS